MTKNTYSAELLELQTLSKVFWHLEQTFWIKTNFRFSCKHQLPIFVTENIWKTPKSQKEIFRLLSRSFKSQQIQMRPRKCEKLKNGRSFTDFKLIDTTWHSNYKSRIRSPKIICFRPFEAIFTSNFWYSRILVAWIRICIAWKCLYRI